MANLLQCYNRGCGAKYSPDENKDDSCRHHPGDPFFHDAYKGWSCCNKKCIDFTEFLNIKGCTLSKHSNVKPVEPEKPDANSVPDVEIVQVKPMVKDRLPRPPLSTSMISLKPEIAPLLKKQLAEVPLIKSADISTVSPTEIPVGTLCKNGGCNKSYEGSHSDNSPCVHHPGVPVFHEGLKYWSCCTKRTSDFNAFLSQVGCNTGTHIWIKEKNDDNENVDCRWDHHQTGSHVIVSIYAKQYCPEKSTITLNPIRLQVNLVFPQTGATFHKDLELKGIVDVEKCTVTMYGTKIEIKLKKAELGSWTSLEWTKIPVREKGPNGPKVETIVSQVQQVDLTDL